MNNKKVQVAFEKIVGVTEEFLDEFKREDGIELINRLTQQLGIEHRWTMLTDEEKADVNDKSIRLSPAARKRLDEVKTETERAIIIKGYARSTYFRECGWKDYLKGVTNKKPFVPMVKK